MMKKKYLALIIKMKKVVKMILQMNNLTILHLINTVTKIVVILGQKIAKIMKLKIKND